MKFLKGLTHKNFNYNSNTSLLYLVKYETSKIDADCMMTTKKPSSCWLLMLVDIMNSILAHTLLDYTPQHVY